MEVAFHYSAKNIHSNLNLEARFTTIVVLLDFTEIYLNFTNAKKAASTAV